MPVYLLSKRLFDIICCLLALPFFLVLFIIVAIGIKLDDGGPVFYKAERIGKGCKKFYMLKFRSDESKFREYFESRWQYI